jgi:hypothetical protein
MKHFQVFAIIIRVEHEKCGDSEYEQLQFHSR